MILRLETTTQSLVPAGTAPDLPRGGLDVVFVQFLTNSVAGLLPNGAPIALRLFQPSDLANPVAVLNEFQANPGSVGYTGSLDTLQNGLAYLQRGTLFGRLSYGNPNQDSGWFLVNYGASGPSAGTPPVQLVITQPTGPVTYTQDIGMFGGEIRTGQTEGFWRVKAPCNVLGLTLNAQVAPVGADILVDIYKGGVAQNKIGKLTAGAKAEETLFDPPLALQIGDVIQFRPTQVGVAKKGSNLQVKAILQLL